IDRTVASFYSLPAIELPGWRPNYHIKASTNGGALAGRTWDNDATTDSPEKWNIFEYGQIEFFESKYGEVAGERDVTADDSMLFHAGSKLFKRTPLIIDKFSANSFENDILAFVRRQNLTDYEEILTSSYARIDEQYGDTTVGFYVLNKSVANTIEKMAQIKGILEDISFLDKERYDVKYKTLLGSVEISLNTVSSNYFQLKSGAKIAVVATQRPKQWGESNNIDYTIVSSVPNTNVSLDNPNEKNLDNTSDRAVTRTVDYFVWDGTKQTVAGKTGGWFESITIESDKITLKMPKLANGNTAKEYWDAIDPSGSPIAPFCLFWIMIQQ
ncbi:MAG TPA: hypothetical protein PK899_07840, partial [Spirochaetota bacterium]|nr:hypothetical protein [Spirochaetota bacterium]